MWFIETGASEKPDGVSRAMSVDTSGFRYVV